MYYFFNKKFVMVVATIVVGFGLFGMAGEARPAFAPMGFGEAQAVREFKASVKASGGDYPSLSAAEDGLDYVGTAEIYYLFLNEK